MWDGVVAAKVAGFDLKLHVTNIETPICKQQRMDIMIGHPRSNLGLHWGPGQW